MTTDVLETKENTVTINIRMLGGFEICADGHCIDESLNRTRQLWTLLKYLIAYRAEQVTLEDLTRIMWPDGDIDNPAGALKNLVYRIRTILTKNNIPHARDMIIFESGVYKWNNDLPCEIDTEILMQMHKAGMDESAPVGERISVLMRAVALYGGDFLAKSRREDWATTLVGRYRRIYIECVHTILSLLEAGGYEKEIEIVCAAAQAIDRYDEKVHLSLMHSLMRQGHNSRAIAHYNSVTDMFARELGSVLPSDMREFRHEMTRILRGKDTALDEIYLDLKETGKPSGAFYCEYEIFKNLYRLEARNAARTGKSIFICLLTVSTGNEHESPNSRRYGDIINGLRDTIQKNMRMGDAFAKFSPTQFILMLPTPDHESCDIAINRLLRCYRQTSPPQGTTVNVKIQPLSPVGEKYAAMSS